MVKVLVNGSSNYLRTHEVREQIWLRNAQLARLRGIEHDETPYKAQSFVFNKVVVKLANMLE